MGNKKRSAAAEFSRAPSVSVKISRFWVILANVIGFLLFLAGQQAAMFLGAEDDPDVLAQRAAERLCYQIAELGPTAVKIAQTISTREDMIGEPWLSYLKRLQSDVPAEPREVTVALLQQELASNLLEVDISKMTPLKQASIGQALLIEYQGRKVLLKVQRSFIVELIRTDLAILRSIAQHCRFVPFFFRGQDLVTTVDQISATFEEELDFRREARNCLELREAFNGSRFPVTIPGVIQPLSTERVLALEFVPGTSPKDFRAPPWLVEKAIRNLVDLFLHQIIMKGFFHADPHPGNIGLEPDGSVVLYDCGMMGRLSESTRKALADMALHVISGDADGVVNDLVAAGIFPPAAIGDSDVRDAISAFILTIRLSGVSGDAISKVAERLRSVTNGIGIQVPPELTLLGRCLLELEGTLGTLAAKSPDINYSLIVLRQASLFILQQTLRNPWGILERMAMDVSRLTRLVPILLENLQRALRQFEAGQLALPVRDDATVKATRKLSPGVRSLNAAVLCGVFSVLAGFSFADDNIILGVPLLLGGLYFFGRWLVSEKRMEN